MIKVEIKNNKLTIEVETEWFLSKNGDHGLEHGFGNVLNEFDACEFMQKYLNEPCIDLGDGDVTPVEKMLMDGLQSAYEDGEDWLQENDEE